MILLRNKFQTLLIALTVCCVLGGCTSESSFPAEDGHHLWLRQHMPDGITTSIDTTMPDDDGYRITGHHIEARTELGLLYGRYAAMRGEQGESHPAFTLRVLNLWDNLDGTVERGYAGGSIFWNRPADLASRLTDGDRKVEDAFGEACASIGINGTVLNNVNAAPEVLTTVYLDSVRTIADRLRPWGVRVYLSVNFGSPKALGDVPTADPLDADVQKWWQHKADEIYSLIPDFGGFLVKANSEGQPGPFDYGRTHADGANMLADALQPHGGIVMWRSFVYGAKHKGEDRVKQAVAEFAELDGQFRPNVILQSKNGPLDFQPREPYAPIFDNMQQTPQMAELQITQEYLGQGIHLAFLAPMWHEFFQYVSPNRLVGIAGVANVGTDTNWCGHHFAQANWYAFGRLAWNPSLTPRQIAEEWVNLTFAPLPSSQAQPATGPVGSGTSAATPPSPDPTSTSPSPIVSLMLRSREACVDYMMPLGLHHIFAFDHHYGPEPDGFKAEYPLEWCPVYYHQADSAGIGFDRTMATGTGATAQYNEPFRSLVENLSTCPDEFLLWFHHVPWTYRLATGRNVLEELDFHYAHGVAEVEDFIAIWQQQRPNIDPQRWQEVDDKLHQQLDNARQWQQVCTTYFHSFTK